jgi:hypothetical protein
MQSEFLKRDSNPGAKTPSLDPLECCEPGWCAVVVDSRLKPVRFDGGDMPSIAVYV